MSVRLYGSLGRHEIHFFLPWQNLITQEFALYQPTMPHHSSWSAPATTTFIVSWMALTSVSTTPGDA